MTMAADKQDKVLNVPTLRFSEFKDDWNDYHLRDLCTFHSGGTPSIDNVEYWEGEIPFVSAVAMHNTHIEKTPLTLTEKGLRDGSKQLEAGNLLLLVRGSMLWNKIPICYNDVDVAFNQDVKGIVPNSKTTSLFLLNWIQSHENRIKYMVTGTGIGAGKLDSEDLLALNVKLPSLIEQKKIEKFLSLIDERIETQIRIIEDLKSERKYLLEQLFCLPNERVPKLRLKGMTGEWQKVKLCYIANRVTEKNKANTCNRVLTIAAQYGLIDQQEFFNKQIASSDLTTYYLLHKGDFAYNKSYSGDYSWGAVKRLDKYDKGVLSSLYICFRPNENVDSDFLCHYFESTKWYRGISEISGEGARNHGLLNMSVDDYFNTLHRIPTLREQKAVANALNVLVDKIDIETEILNDLQKQKSYLLKEMFI
ncbi:MAG: Uncharacterized protein F082_1168 [bacterium F082]|nr:MAG: Uncharacterized protein F082_1168 [bacterium F082]